jgi:hypothetical protein
LRLIPREELFHYPPAREHLKANLTGRLLDDLDADRSGLSRSLSGIATVAMYGCLAPSRTRHSLCSLLSLPVGGPARAEQTPSYPLF